MGTREAPSGAGVATVAEWLRSEHGKHCSLLTQLRDRLSQTIASDITEGGVPSRDWCRAYGRYQTGLTAYMTEERERVKLSLLAGKQGDQPLTDDEYQAGLEQLALESLGEASDVELKAEIQRRGLKVVVVDEEGEDE